MAVICKPALFRRLNTFREYLTFSYLCPILRQYRVRPICINELKCPRQLSTHVKENDAIDEIFPDVVGSPKSIPPEYFKKIKKNRKHPKSKSTFKEDLTDKSGHVIIQCKNKSLNHYINQTYDKFNPIPIASKGWLSRKSKGDYFKINIYPEKEQRENVFWSYSHESFENLGLDENVRRALEKLGITRPTQVQVEGIPQVLNNQNVLLAGETGCGKTLAYLLPVVQEIIRWRPLTTQRKLNTPLALILVPGRELAFQIGDVADQLSRELKFDLEVTVGGHTKRLITHPNFRPVDLFISSVGAASKLTTSGIYNMSFVRHIVLDEADTLMDDSFNEHLVRYLKKFPLSFGTGKTNAECERLPTFCQLTLASATMPTSVVPILENIIATDSLVKVETKRLHQVMVHVPQVFYRLGQSQKPAKLLEIVKQNIAKQLPTVIFSNRSKTCDWVSLFLNENGVSCLNLNGDMPSDVRVGRFDQFQRGIVDVLSCTDVASRGLDTIRAKHVLNYDFPIYMADYIHRCGRVGRVNHSQDCLITNLVAGEREVELTQKIETAVRTMSTLPNVNANVTRIIEHKIFKN